MAKANLYNAKGEKQGEVDLNPAVFEVKINENLVHQALVAILANSRYNFAHTKDRSDVRGGGKKPWRQKGTGRARVGSNRSPLWKGGGVTFGPACNVNFAKKLNKKMRAKALLMILSDRAENGNVAIISELSMEKPQTFQMVELLKRIEMPKKTLLVIDKMEENIFKSIRNYENAEVLAANSLNVKDLLNNENVVFTQAALPIIEKNYLIK